MDSGSRGGRYAEQEDAGSPTGKIENHSILERAAQPLTEIKMNMLQYLKGLLFAVDEQSARLGRLLFPRKHRAGRRLIVLWAFLLTQVAIFALVISGERFGCG